MNRKVTFLALFFSASLLFSACSGKNNRSGSFPGGSPDEATISENAKFSVSIDGIPVSGTKIDNWQLQNTAFIYPVPGSDAKSLLFFLYSDKQGADFYYFRFSLPEKVGIYKFNQETNKVCNCHLMLDFDLKSLENYSRYDEDSATVTVDKLTSSRISGTFSGRLKLSNDTRSKSYKSSVMITDGKFDIPFSTGKMRPQ